MHYFDCDMNKLWRTGSVGHDSSTICCSFEKYKSDGDTMYAFAGYMTVYNYYAYPEKVRPRISQVLVMPPFQRQGHGAKLLQTFYNDCYSRSNILDITGTLDV